MPARAEVGRAGRGARVADRVAFIATYGRHSCPGRDRSYGEIQLLDHAMTTSRPIAAVGERAVVWKITGRYQSATRRGW